MYIEPIIALHSMVGHAAVTSILQVQRGTLADRSKSLRIESVGVCDNFIESDT